MVWKKIARTNLRIQIVYHIDGSKIVTMASECLGMLPIGRNYKQRFLDYEYDFKFRI